MGTLSISKQLEGLVTLEMSRSHKALCLDPVTAGSGLFCGSGLARERRATVYRCNTKMRESNSSLSI